MEEEESSTDKRQSDRIAKWPDAFSGTEARGGGCRPAFGGPVCLPGRPPQDGRHLLRDEEIRKLEISKEGPNAQQWGWRGRASGVGPILVLTEEARILRCAVPSPSA